MLRGRSNDVKKKCCGKCIPPGEFVVWPSSTKEGFQIHGSRDQSHSPLQVAHMTDHFCSDCFDQITAYIDESNLRNEIRMISNNTKCRKLTRSSPLVPP